MTCGGSVSAGERAGESERAGRPRCWAGSVCWVARASATRGERGRVCVRAAGPFAGPSRREGGKSARAAVFVFLFRKCK
jgi:hypothetical protein